VGEINARSAARGAFILLEKGQLCKNLVANLKNPPGIQLDRDLRNKNCDLRRKF
jgi:hypothetical protein